MKKIPLLIRAAAATVLTVFAVSCETASRRDTGPLIQVGLAEIDITPGEAIRLSGYGSRSEPSEGVAQRLRAKAMAIGSDQEGPVVLVTVDLIGVPGDLVDRLSERLEERTGGDRSRLVVAATHTHTGPDVEGTIPNLFGEELPEGQRRTIRRYTEELEEKLTQVALEALAARDPARLDWARGEVSFAVNRRVLEEGKWTGFGVNPDGPVDHDLPLLTVTAPDGRLRGLLVAYACHCTTLGGDFNKVHGDWAGEAQAVLETRHDGLIAMVAIGAGADANPDPRTNLDYVAAHGTAVADEVDRLLRQGVRRPLAGPPETRFERIELSFDPEYIPTRREWEERAGEHGAAGLQARKMLERLDRGRQIPTSMSYPVQTWVFGDELAMVFLGGEVVVDYSLRLKRELDGDRLWVNAYSNDAACYIPSQRVIGEGGYEVDFSMIYYDRPARFSGDVEERIIQTVHRLLPEGFRAGR